MEEAKHLLLVINDTTDLLKAKIIDSMGSIYVECESISTPGRTGNHGNINRHGNNR